MDSIQALKGPERHTQQAVDEIQEPFRKIGNGSYGIIFADPTHSTVYKRELRAGDKDCLWNLKLEYAMHSVIAAVFEGWTAHGGLQVSVPRPQRLILEESDWWKSNAKRFPAEEPRYQRPSSTIMAERILSLPGTLRHQLVRTFGQTEALKHKFTTDPSLDICLVRLYLGRESRTRNPNANTSKHAFFQIRNFPCHIDQMEALELDTHFIATQLGCALAVLHFEAMTDARDVEFVLGRARSTALPTAMKDFIGPNRTLSIWCLDFNQCQNLAWDFSSSADDNADALQKCIDAYFLNDPYYPRPGQNVLWEPFADKYRDMATQIMHKRKAQNVVQLAAAFLQGVEERRAANQGKQGL